ncbi:hypothetical protein MD484_g2415, partial [Candolleomyces efflorescens]
MNPDPNAEPGAGPAEGRGVLSDKETIALLRRRLLEAEEDVKEWREQAEEARKELVKSKSNAKVLQKELDNTLREVAQALAEVSNKDTLASGSRQETKSEQTGGDTVEDPDVSRDYALARQLDEELNMVTPASVAEPRDTSQLEKVKARIQALKKKLVDMEATAYHYQKLHHKERSHHVRTYNQARMLEMEFNSARKHIHAQDDELKSARNELKEMQEMKEELGSFLGRWNDRVGLLPVSETVSLKTGE